MVDFFMGIFNILIFFVDFAFFSQVFMAKEIQTGEIVALKKIRMDNEKEGVNCFCVNIGTFCYMFAFTTYTHL